MGMREEDRREGEGVPVREKCKNRRERRKRGYSLNLTL